MKLRDFIFQTGIPVIDIIDVYKKYSIAQKVLFWIWTGILSILDILAILLFIWMIYCGLTMVIL